MSKGKYEGVLNILRSAQKSIEKVLPTVALNKELPNPFSTIYNERLAQAIYLMADRLAYHGENNSVTLTSIGWYSLAPLKKCITALQGENNPFFIPNLSQADDDTFKLSVIYLSVLKSLDKKLCPDSADYIAVLGVSPDFLNALTVDGPAILTTALVTYFKKMNDEKRKTELLDFVKQANLKELELKLELTSSTNEVEKNLTEINTELKKIKSFSRVNWQAILAFPRLLSNIRLNHRGHVLLTVANEEAVPNNLSLDKLTLVKFKEKLNNKPNVVRAYRYEWSKTFSLLLTESPQSVTDLKLQFNKEDDAYYKVGIIRVKNTNGLNQVFCLDRQTNTLEKLNFSSAELDELDKIIKFSPDSCSYVPDSKLADIETRKFKLNLTKKRISFDLDIENSAVKNLEFPEDLGQSKDQPFDKEKYTDLYRYITKIYRYTYPVFMPSTVDLSDEINTLSEKIRSQTDQIVSLNTDIANLKETIKQEENKEMSQKGTGIEHVISNVVGDLAHFAVKVSGMTNVGGHGYFDSQIDKLTHSQQEVNKQNIVAKVAEKELLLKATQNELPRNKLQLLRLKIDQIADVQLNNISKDCNKFSKNLDVRLQQFKKETWTLFLSNKDSNTEKYQSERKALIDKQEEIQKQYANLVSEKNNLLESIRKDFQSECEEIDKLLMTVETRCDQIEKNISALLDQDSKMVKMEESATSIAQILRDQAKIFKRNVSVYSTQLPNFLPSFFFLAGTAALTISLGILLGNPHFLAAFVVLSMQYTIPTAMLGVGVGGGLAVGSIALASIKMYDRFFDSKLSKVQDLDVSQQLTAVTAPTR